MKKKGRLLCPLLACAVLAAFSGCSGTPAASSSPSGGSPSSSSAAGDVSLSADSSAPSEPSAAGESSAPASGDTGGKATSTTKNNVKGDSETCGVQNERVRAGNVSPSGFPLVKNSTTLRVMVEKSSLHSDFNTMKFTTEYEKMTGVKIKWEIYATNERLAKIATTLGAGNPPEVMCMLDAFTSSNIVDYAKKTAILPLDDKFEKWAPNVAKALSENEMAKKSVTAPDGHIYSVPLIRSQQNHEDFPQKIFINQSWLDALGLDMPETYADMIKVLTAFKNNDPNGNGQKDEIPMAIEGFSPMFAGGPQGIAWNWTQDRMYVDSNGKIGYFMASDAYRDSLKFFKTLWSQNLIDQGCFKGDTQVKTKVQTGRVGVFTSLAGSIDLKEKDLKNYTIMPVLKATADSTPTVMAAQNSKVMPFSMVITASAAKDQKLEIALRWVDYFFTTDGYIMEQYGPANGGFYKKLQNGKLEIISGKSDSDRYKITPGYVLPSWSTQGTVDRFAEKAESAMTTAEKFFENVDSDLSEKYYRPLVQTRYIPTLFFDKADANTLITKANDVHSLGVNQGYAFIQGDRNIDTDWNAYINELKSKGLDEMVSIYQKAYDAVK